MPATFALTHSPDGDSRLAGWRENVGGLVAVDAPAGPQGAEPIPAADPAPKALTILSWNLWIGRGRLEQVVGAIRQGVYTGLGAEPDAPLVVLAQEAYRADASIPERSNGWAPREIDARARPRDDIVVLADRLGMSLRYAPSMRNGTERSDRGSAILSSAPLGAACALELPLVFQRRVAVTATVDLGGHRLQLVSAHLDPRGPPDHRWLGAAGRALHTKYLLTALADDTVILGADLNLGRGRRERTWRLLAEAGFTFGTPPGLPPWRHTYHALPRLVLDYILIRNRSRAVASATIHRLDEDPKDRSRTVFGSDHHPLLAPIELA
jgi:endonuclease/exonuclease/phosphatase family metal-dependent hydrolase